MAKLLLQIAVCAKWKQAVLCGGLLHWVSPTFAYYKYLMLAQALFAKLVSHVGLFSLASGILLHLFFGLFSTCIKTTIARAQLLDADVWRTLMAFSCILICVMTYDSGGVIIIQSTYIQPDVIPKFIRSMLHSLAAINFLDRWNLTVCRRLIMVLTILGCDPVLSSTLLSFPH